MEKQKSKTGSLEVICGSMFSGKSEELIRRMKRAEIARQNILVFKHGFDQRTLIEYVTSHSGGKLKSIPTTNPKDIEQLMSPEIDVVGIDEIQFFDNEIVNIVCTLVDQGKRVIVSGLDLDHKRAPFGPMPLLMAIADDVTKLKAICMCCGKDAHFSQRLINDKPANSSDPVVMVGAQELYQARCRQCHKIDKSPTF